MNTGWQEQVRPGAALRTLVQEATAALIAMDAERLEELAQCCVDLNRGLQGAVPMAPAAAEIRRAAGDVNLLGRVLLETRANLVVISRLRAIRLRERFARLGETAQSSSAHDCWPCVGERATYGDN